MDILTVKWPGTTTKHAEIWRVLDLAAITSSPRDSELAIRSGAVFVDGERITSLRTQLELGRVYRIEVNQGLRLIRKYVRVVNASPRGKPRNTGPRVMNYKR